MNFDNYQLYRTTPKLSGNMKWDIIVGLDENSELIVKDFHIRPISSNVPYTLISDDYILNRPHQLNIKDFYDQVKGNMYNCSPNPELESDWPIILPESTSDDEIKYMKDYDDTFWGGTQRMLYSTYKTTHEILVPLWLENIEKSLMFKFGDRTLKINRLGDEIPRKKYTFHERFCKYLFEYFDYLGLDEGNNKCITIDFPNKNCSIYGIDVKSGNLITRNDSNITNNLVSRERPLMEQNSIITNTYHDLSMITAQMMNFNIVFDSSELNLKGNIEMDVYVDKDDEAIEKRDIFTNHQFVPRFTPCTEIGKTKEEQDSDYNVNALDYLNDYNCLDLVHKDKIIQSIPHWSLVGTNILFNVYDGFGDYYKDGDRTLYLTHQYGQTLQPFETDWNDSLWNWKWVDKVLDIDNLNYITDLEHKYSDLVDGGYLVPLSKFFNNLGYDFEEGDENFYFGVGLYGIDVIQSNGWFLGSSTSPDIEKEGFDTNNIRISIWDDRFDNYTIKKDGGGYDFYYNQSLSDYGTLVWYLDPECGNSEKLIENTYHGSPNSNILGQRDHRRDCTIHTDYNNRFGEFLALIDTGIYVEEDKKDYGVKSGWLHSSEGWAVYHEPGNALEKCHKLTMSLYKEGDKTYILFSAWKDEGKEIFEAYIKDQGAGSFLELEEPYVSKLPSCLCLGNIVQAFDDYISYYRKKLGEVESIISDDESMQDKIDSANVFLNTLDNISSKLRKFKIPEVVYFNNSIGQEKDKVLDTRTQEINYYKKTNTNNYVLRYSGNIRPAMFPLNKEHKKTYGVNYLWRKDTGRLEDLLNEHSAYKKYAYTNISPKYPSVDYDSIRSYSFDGESTPFELDPLTTPYIDIESKWFDKSIINNLPHEVNNIKLAIYVNDKDTLENSAMEYYNQYQGTSYDKVYLKKWYNIYYSLHDIDCSDEPVEDTEGYIVIGKSVIGDDGKYILYKYDISFELK